MKAAPCIPGLFEERAHPIADTSREAYARILPTLQARQRAVLIALSDLCERQPDATGGELAAFMGTLITSVRPRLTELTDLGLIVTTPTRSSTARFEGRCHGYRPAVPRAAISRLRTV